MISFRADQNGRVERVNDNKKVCKKACCCRETMGNNERGAGKGGVKRLMEMSVCVHTFCSVSVLLYVCVWMTEKRKYFLSDPEKLRI